MLRRMLESSAFAVAERLSRLRVRARIAPSQSVISKDEIRRALDGRRRLPAPVIEAAQRLGRAAMSAIRSTSSTARSSTAMRASLRERVGVRHGARRLALGLRAAGARLPVRLLRSSHFSASCICASIQTLRSSTSSTDS